MENYLNEVHKGYIDNFMSYINAVQSKTLSEMKNKKKHR